MCFGKGKIIEDFCNSCYGYGCKEKIKIFNVKIFVGVDIGDRICLLGEGEVGGNGVFVGDLYV